MDRMPLMELAQKLGVRITRIHSRPGPAGLEQCGVINGKTERLSDIRAFLEARWQDRELRNKALQR